MKIYIVVQQYNDDGLTVGRLGNAYTDQIDAETVAKAMNDSRGEDMDGMTIVDPGYHGTFVVVPVDLIGMDPHPQTDPFPYPTMEGATGVATDEKT